MFVRVVPGCVSVFVCVVPRCVCVCVCVSVCECMCVCGLGCGCVCAIYSHLHVSKCWSKCDICVTFIGTVDTYCKPIAIGYKLNDCAKLLISYIFMHTYKHSDAQEQS